MKRERVSHPIPLVFLFVTSTGLAADRHPGTATVRVADTEYAIPIECNDASRPELGFSTEPSRITREKTGRTSGIRLNVRPWKETSYLVISLDRYVAWVPSQASAGSILKMTLDMSPSSTLENGVPVALTYDRWMAGKRPVGLQGVSFEADCSVGHPEMPTMRKAADLVE